MYVTSSAAEAAALRTHLANGDSAHRAKASCGPNSKRAQARRLAVVRSREVLRIVQAGHPKPEPGRVRLLTISGDAVEFLTGLARVAR